MTDPESAVGESTAGIDLRTAFEEHADGMLRLCTLLSGRRDLAEDLVQDAFVRLASRIDRLDRDAVGPYVRRIAINLWKNRVRRLILEARHRGRELPVPSPTSWTSSESQDLWDAVRRLPPRQRACVVLRYFEDHTEVETAKLMGCSVGTVKSQVAKALRRLRTELGDVT